MSKKVRYKDGDGLYAPNARGGTAEYSVILPDGQGFDPSWFVCDCATFRLDRPGSNEGWCRHIEEALALAVDADYLSDFVGRRLIQVPMFRSVNSMAFDVEHDRWAIWAGVSVEPYRSTAAKLVTFAAENVCLIVPGDGRKTIRSALIRHLLNVDPPACTSKLHQESKSQRALLDDKMRVLDALDRYTESKCSLCRYLDAAVAVEGV